MNNLNISEEEILKELKEKKKQESIEEERKWCEHNCGIW